MTNRHTEKWITFAAPLQEFKHFQVQGEFLLFPFFSLFLFILKLNQQNKVVWLKQHSGKRKVESLSVKNQLWNFKPAALPPLDKVENRLKGEGNNGNQGQWWSACLQQRSTFKVSAITEIFKKRLYLNWEIITRGQTPDPLAFIKIFVPFLGGSDDLGQQGWSQLFIGFLYFWKQVGGGVTLPEFLLTGNSHVISLVSTISILPLCSWLPNSHLHLSSYSQVFDLCIQLPPTWLSHGHPKLIRSKTKFTSFSTKPAPHTVFLSQWM